MVVRAVGHSDTILVRLILSAQHGDKSLSLVSPMPVDRALLMSSPQITTLLLDCDNTLVQSEALAFDACADLTNDILSKCGIDLQFTGPQLQREFVGQNFQDMVRVWLDGGQHQIPRLPHGFDRY